MPIVLLLASFGCARLPAGAFGTLDRAVAEPSGLIKSRAHAGVFWTHNDSGDSARIFAVDGQGALLAELPVEDAKNIDWEDLTLDSAGRLWIGDIGDNTNTREDLALYLLDAEPSLSGPAVASRRVPIRYPDRDPELLDFDAEALFADGERLYILTKHRSGDLSTTLYAVPDPLGGGEVTLSRISELNIGGDPRRYGGMVTAADLSADGETLAVLSYHALFLFGRPEDGQDWLSRPLKEIPLDQGALEQCESVAWDGDALLITNEDRAMFRVNAPLATTCVAFPGEGCA
ncbi:hypothetical protein L6R49_27695 [Myxococcota bacterium]|nr:hypothetical protein [Myxococcota bacterium]